MVGNPGGANQESSDHLLGECNFSNDKKNSISFFISTTVITMFEVNKEVDKDGDNPDK